MRARCPSICKACIIRPARLQIISLLYSLFDANPAVSPTKYIMTAEVPSPGRQLISQSAYIVWLRWPSSKVWSLTFRKGNDKCFL